MFVNHFQPIFHSQNIQLDHSDLINVSGINSPMQMMANFCVYVEKMQVFGCPLVLIC